MKLLIILICIASITSCTTGNEKVCKTVCVPNEECVQKCRTDFEWNELDGY